MSAEVSSPPTVTPPLAAVEEGADPDAVVHAAGTHHKAGFRWGYFLILNAIAGAIAIGIFFGIQHGEVLDPYMAGTYEWLLAHPMATSLMAFSPLLASLLVGWGYSQRARKRRAAAAEALNRSRRGSPSEGPAHESAEKAASREVEANA